MTALRLRSNSVNCFKRLYGIGVFEVRGVKVLGCVSSGDVFRFVLLKKFASTLKGVGEGRVTINVLKFIIW